MRALLIVLFLLIGSVTSAVAQVSIGIGLPSVSIGINVAAYPTLVRVPGYPCYYAPRVHANYFFYDGMYWVYVDDNWYSAYWYNGPWVVVAPEVVPLFVLRIPVRYYGAPPVYFASWRRDAPPRWDQHWGGTWAQHRAGWDRWDRRSVPAAAPLPAYQRRYAGNRYPQVEQQRAIVGQSYRYQPRDAVVRQHFQEHVQRAPAPAARTPQAARQESSPRPQAARQESQRQASRQESSPRPQPARPESQRQASRQESSPRPQEIQRSSRPAPDVQRSAPVPSPQRERVVQREQPQRAAPEAMQGRGAAPEQRRGGEQGAEKDQEKGGGERGHGKN